MCLKNTNIITPNKSLCLFFTGREEKKKTQNNQQIKTINQHKVVFIAENLPGRSPEV